MAGFKHGSNRQMERSKKSYHKAPCCVTYCQIPLFFLQISPLNNTPSLTLTTVKCQRMGNRTSKPCSELWWIPLWASLITQCAIFLPTILKHQTWWASEMIGWTLYNLDLPSHIQRELGTNFSGTDQKLRYSNHSFLSSTTLSMHVVSSSRLHKFPWPTARDSARFLHFKCISM
jgi:hypothetical protein